MKTEAKGVAVGADRPETREQDPRQWERPCEAVAHQSQGYMLRREHSGSHMPSGLWLPAWPGALPLLISEETLSSPGEASHNLHLGVKFHTARVQWPTALACCANTPGRFLALPKNLGGEATWALGFISLLSVGISLAPAAHATTLPALPVGVA